MGESAETGSESGAWHWAPVCGASTLQEAEFSGTPWRAGSRTQGASSPPPGRACLPSSFSSPYLGSLALCPYLSVSLSPFPYLFCSLPVSLSASLFLSVSLSQCLPHCLLCCHPALLSLPIALSLCKPASPCPFAAPLLLPGSLLGREGVKASLTDSLYASACSAERWGLGGLRIAA